jgi:hypothetical protein
MRLATTASTLRPLTANGYQTCEPRVRNQEQDVFGGSRKAN